MSRRDDEGRVEYDVGYGKPPTQTRFKTGRSGNPKGRPKGAGSKHKRLVAYLQPTREIILEEAYAPVAMREGDRVVQVAAIRAVMKATIKAAVTGGQMAQRTLLQFTQQNENQVAEERRETFQSFMQWKAEREMDLKKCRAAGLPEPDFVPHPDDIYLDWDTFGVEVRGPMTPEQKAAFDDILGMRDSYAQNVQVGRASMNQDPRPWDIPVLVKRAQEHFDAINDLLPERYRRALPGRMSDDEIVKAVARARKHLTQRKQRSLKPKPT